MPNQAPTSFPSNRYQWTLRAHTRIRQSDYCVYFSFLDDYQKLLDDPFEMVRMAKDAGCNTVLIYAGNYVSDLESPRIALNVDSVLRLGSRLEFVG